MIPLKCKSSFQPETLEQIGLAMRNQSHGKVINLPGASESSGQLLSSHRHRQGRDGTGDRESFTFTAKNQRGHSDQTSLV